MKAILVKYLPPTNHRGARLKASDGDGSHATIPYPPAEYANAHYRQAALTLCAKMGWTGTLIGGTLVGVGEVFVFDDESARVAIPA